MLQVTMHPRAHDAFQRSRIIIDSTLNWDESVFCELMNKFAGVKRQLALVMFYSLLKEQRYCGWTIEQILEREG